MAHTHHHSHGHHHHAPQSFNLAFAIAVSFNLGFTIIQVVYAWLAGSMSLLADAAHNFGDVLGLVLAWGANWLLTLPARKRYSYGFKRTTIFAAILNALLLVASSSVIAYESIIKLHDLHQVNSLMVMCVATLGIIINGGTALLFIKGSHDDLNIKGAFLHLMADALISIGVVVGAGLIWMTHWVWIDPVMGLMIVVIIFWNTWGLLRDSLRLMLDAIPHYIDYNGVRHYLETLPGVKAVHDFHIWGLSTKEIALTAHLIMPETTLSDQQLREIDQHLKKQYRVDHVTLQVEQGNESYPCPRIEGC